MTTTVLLDVGRLHTAIQEEYTEVAACPLKGFHFHTGRFLAQPAGLSRAAGGSLPDAVVESFAGVGNPFSWGDLNPGETVVDLGSGAGFDALLAASMVGPDGRVIGIDMTRGDAGKARPTRQMLGHGPYRVSRGPTWKTLPLPDATADVVISNGVINLCPDKAAVLAEAYRVLKPGGRMQLADIVVAKAVPEDGKADIALWTG